MDDADLDEAVEIAHAAIFANRNSILLKHFDAFRFDVVLLTF